jgi:hypothetical protein
VAARLERRHKREREKKRARLARARPRESITPSMDTEDMTYMASGGAGNPLSMGVLIHPGDTEASSIVLPRLGGSIVAPISPSTTPSGPHDGMSGSVRSYSIPLEPAGHDMVSLPLAPMTWQRSVGWCHPRPCPLHLLRWRSSGLPS